MNNEIVHSITELKEEWKNEWIRLQELSKTRDIILVGAGKTSEEIIREFENHNIKPVVFCDNDKTKYDNVICGRKVCSIDEAKTVAKKPLWYITTQLYYTVLFNQLIEMGIMETDIIKYDLICQFTWERNYKDFVLNHKEKFEEIFALLDEESKKVLQGRLKFLITRKREFATEIRGDIQYFEDFMHYENIECFVDLGTYTGDTIIQFTDLINNSRCKFIAFEMDKQILEKAKQNLAYLGERVVYENCAVSDIDGKINIEGNMGEMQTIVPNNFVEASNSSNGLWVDSCTLDSYFDQALEYKNYVLKLDVEGAEMSTLNGGRSFIKKNKPRIAVCIYHKEDDVFTILDFLKELHPDYQFRIRHYSDNQTETVLYAL